MVSEFELNGAKIKLYSLLLGKDAKELTESEIELMFVLSNEVNVRQHLKDAMKPRYQHSVTLNEAYSKFESSSTGCKIRVL